MNDMNITAAKYIADITDGGQNVSIKATINGVEMSVPLASGNRHYDEIMRQQSEGLLTIADAD